MNRIQRFAMLAALFTTAAASAIAASSGLTPAAPTSTAAPLSGPVLAREVTIPAGSSLAIALDSSLASDRSRVEDVVRAHVRRPLIIRGATVIPAGSTLIGHVTRVRRPGKVKGRGYLAFRFDRLELAQDSQRLAVRTSAVGRLAPSGKNRDVKTIAIPAVGGAVVGAIAGGKKGAAIGAAAGGGGGTAVALSTRGPEARVGRGATATIKLVSPLTVRVKG